MKTTVFNLIILDESGSMSGLEKRTISGCNEVIQVARNGALDNRGELRSLVSVYAFSSGCHRSRYILKNEDATTVREIVAGDYRPNGGTPLLDAVGSTLSELKTVSATHEDATGIITIITDGMENSSTHYRLDDVRRLISYFKEQGWTVNLIGSEIDVDAIADTVGIENRMNFSHDEKGTREMFATYKSSMNMRYQEYAEEAACPDASERRQMRLTHRNKFFGK